MKRLQQVWKDITIDDITIKLDDIFIDTRHSDVRLTGKWIDTMSRKYSYLIDDYKRLVKIVILHLLEKWDLTKRWMFGLTLLLKLILFNLRSNC